MNKIKIKTAEEANLMRIAGRKASELLDMISEHVRVGVTTDYLNQLCHQYTVETLRCIPAPLNYKGFPKSICTSINEQICHGIPDQTLLKDGDILNIDVTVIHEGFHGDTSRMFSIGDVAPEAKKLVAVTRKCMHEGIKQVAPGKRIGEIGHIIEQIAKMFNYSVVQEYGGHGIGREFHEPPAILHYSQKDWGEIMVPGMAFTVEPMINIGRPEIVHLDDGWTVVTADGSLSAQWEHTVLVTDSGYEILTDAAS